MAQAPGIRIGGPFFAVVATYGESKTKPLPCFDIPLSNSMPAPSPSSSPGRSPARASLLELALPPAASWDTEYRPRSVMVFVRPGFGYPFWLRRNGSENGFGSLQQLAQRLVDSGIQEAWGLPLERSSVPGDARDLSQSERAELSAWLRRMTPP